MSIWIPPDSDFALAFREPNLLVPNSRPTVQVRIKQYWLSRGLKSAWFFGNGKAVDVAFNRSATLSNTTSGADYLDTTDLSASYIDIPVFDNPTNPPYSFVSDTEKLTGTVQWSYLQNTSKWYGIYLEDTGQVKTSVNNSFDGSVTGTSDGVNNTCSAVSHSSNNLRVSYRGGAVVQDTSASAPSTIDRNFVTIGGARLNSSPVATSSTRVRLFLSFDQSLSDEELRLLSANPYQIFEPINDTPFMVGTAAAGAIDLGAASAKHVHKADSAGVDTGVVELGAASANHPHTVDTAALSDAKIQLGAAEAKHVHTSDVATLNTTQTVGAANAKHAHRADAAALSNAKVQLGAAEARHTHKADSATITTAAEVGAASAKHAHKADTATLSDAKIQLGAAEAKHAHKADSATIITAAEIGAASAKHAHKADAAALSSAKIQLGAASAKHTHKAGDSTFVVGFVLAAAAAKHIHKSDAAQFGQVKQDLAALSAKHAHKADAAGVTTAAEVLSASAKHTHKADAAPITVEQITIGAVSAKHTHISETAILSGIKQTMLSADAKHAHTAEFVRFWSAVPALRPSPDRVFTPEVVVRRYEP